LNLKYLSTVAIFCGFDISISYVAAPLLSFLGIFFLFIVYYTTSGRYLLLYLLASFAISAPTLFPALPMFMGVFYSIPHVMVNDRSMISSLVLTNQTVHPMQDKISAIFLLSTGFVIEIILLIVTLVPIIEFAKITRKALHRLDMMHMTHRSTHEKSSPHR
jgi:hypothetical protein